MGRGRRPSGPRLVDGLEGSELAKRRLEVILQTVAGELTVNEACTAMGVKRSAFHKLRRQTLQTALSDLEPGVPGRPRKVVTPEAQKLAELEAERDRLQEDLELSQVREELALVLPSVAKREVAGRKKKPRRKRSRRRKKGK